MTSALFKMSNMHCDAFVSWGRMLAYQIGPVVAGPGLDLSERVHQGDVGAEIGLVAVGLRLWDEEALASGDMGQPFEENRDVVLRLLRDGDRKDLEPMLGGQFGALDLLAHGQRGRLSLADQDHSTAWKERRKENTNILFYWSSVE